MTGRSLTGIALFAVCFACTPVEPTRPNILVVVADDLGEFDLASIATPNLDAFAAGALAFPRYYGLPGCSPSRAWSLYGVPPWRYGIYTIVKPARRQSDPELNPPVPFHLLSIAEALKTVGYRTFCTGKDHTNNEHQPDPPRDAPLEEGLRIQGFDTRRAGTAFGLGGRDDYYHWDRWDDGVSTRVEGVFNTRVITDETIAFMQATTDPWFAWVAYNAPHSPFERVRAEDLPPGFAYSADPDKRELFEGLVVSLDHYLGRLFEAVPDDTVVFFYGDNGTPGAAVAEAQDSARVKGSVFDNGVSPPFFVRGPNVVVGSTDTLISEGDLWATWADLAGWGGEAPADSRSFTHVLESGGGHVRDHALSFQAYPNGGEPTSGRNGVQVRVTSQAGASWILIDRDGDVGPKPPVEMLVGANDEDQPFDPVVAAALREVAVSAGLLR